MEALFFYKKKSYLAVSVGVVGIDVVSEGAMLEVSLCIVDEVSDIVSDSVEVSAHAAKHPIAKINSNFFICYFFDMNEIFRVYTPHIKR